MDRGGGRGHGGPARHGSSLPRTLHSSLLHTGSHDPAAPPAEAAAPLQLEGGRQDEHTPYAPYSSGAPQPYSPSVSPPFVEGSSRASPPPALPIEQPQPRSRHATPLLYLPPFRGAGAGSTDPALYASSLGERPSASTSTFFTFPPPAPARLPPVRSLERTAAPSTSAAPVAGPSYSQNSYYSADLRRGLAAHDEFNERTLRRQQRWEPPRSHDEVPLAYGSAYEPSSLSGAEHWAQVDRPENLPHEVERSTGAHLSAARSTISEFLQGPSSSRVHYEYATQSQPTTPVRPAPVPDFSSIPSIQPFHESASARSPFAEDTSFELPEAEGRRPAVLPLPTFDYSTPEPWAVRQREAVSRPPSPRTVSRGASTASGGPPGKRPGGSDDDDSDSPRPRKVPKKTQIACYFCRGRKLKCDGQQPMCGNCTKRKHPCSYAPFPKRRGPGKAPKGHRRAEPMRAPGSGEGSQAPSTDQGLRARASVETLPAYTQYPSASDVPLPGAASPPYAYSPPPVASSSRAPGPSTPGRPYAALQLQYPEARLTPPPFASPPYARAPVLPPPPPPDAWGEETLMDTDEGQGPAGPSPPPDAFP